MSNLQPLNVVFAHELGHALAGESLGFQVASMTFGPVNNTTNTLRIDIDRRVETTFSSFGSAVDLPARLLIASVSGVVAEMLYEGHALSSNAVINRMRSDDNVFDFSVFEAHSTSPVSDDALFIAAQEAWRILQPLQEQLTTGVKYGTPFLVQHLADQTDDITFSWHMLQETIAEGELSEK